MNILKRQCWKQMIHFNKTEAWLHQGFLGFLYSTIALPVKENWTEFPSKTFLGMTRNSSRLIKCLVNLVLNVFLRILYLIFLTEDLGRIQICNEYFINIDLLGLLYLCFKNYPFFQKQIHKKLPVRYTGYSN